MSARKLIYLILGVLFLVSIILSVFIFFDFLKIPFLSKEKNSLNNQQEDFLKKEEIDQSESSPDYVENTYIESIDNNGKMVTDLAELIPEKKEQEIEEKLNTYTTETTNVINVLTVKSLSDETIESYANKIFNRWKIGAEGKNNGILILATHSQVRIEIGLDLETKLTNELASEILAKDFIPYFKENDISEGIIKGIDSLIEHIK